MALNGTEILYVQGVDAQGRPAAIETATTTQAIANLAGVTGVDQIVLDGSTSGTTTIVPAAVAGTTTATFPAATGTVAVITASGTFTCNGATPVTVAQTAITANSQVLVTLKTVGGTVGATPAVKTITATTGFTIAGTASDTSVYNYAIIG